MTEGACQKPLAVSDGGVVRSMFAHRVVMGVLDKSPAGPIKAERPAKDEDNFVQGPYSDAQVKAILANVENSIPINLPFHQRATYAQRIRLFIRMLEGIGCDVSDAIQFAPANLKTMKIGRKHVHVYRYKRQKTGVLAVVPIADVQTASARQPSPQRICLTIERNLAKLLPEEKLSLIRRLAIELGLINRDDSGPASGSGFMHPSRQSPDTDDLLEVA